METTKTTSREILEKRLAKATQDLKDIQNEFEEYKPRSLFDRDAKNTVERYKKLIAEMRFDAKMCEYALGNWLYNNKSK